MLETTSCSLTSDTKIGLEKAQSLTDILLDDQHCKASGTDALDRTEHLLHAGRRDIATDAEVVLHRHARKQATVLWCVRYAEFVDGAELQHPGAIRRVGLRGRGPRPMRTQVDAWAEKNKVDVTIDFITSNGNKIEITQATEAQARTGHDFLPFYNWEVNTHAGQLEPMDDVVKAMTAKYGEEARSTSVEDQRTLELAQFLEERTQVEERDSAANGYDLLPLISMSDFAIWSEAEPPKAQSMFIRGGHGTTRTKTSPRIRRHRTSRRRCIRAPLIRR